MGAKKKGGLANRLARMSDEDRAKYLQRKADIEEEAKRRKEQLVTTFMKNKLKKEDAFSRLNIAKINQQYHQSMRIKKCADMKTEAKHLNITMNRVINLKEKTVSKVMDELKWQEDLYLKNFRNHSNHMDKIIEFHNKQLSELRQQFETDKKWILDIGLKEKNALKAQANENFEYLNGIRYGQEMEALSIEKTNRQDYITRTDELITNYKTELSDMKKHRESIISSLWTQISKILFAYIQRNDTSRSHLAELQRLDHEGMVAVTQNQNHIKEQEKEFKNLKDHFSQIKEDQENKIIVLKDTIKLTTEKFFKMRKTLNYEIDLDSKQLIHLTNVSKSAIENLQSIANKGERILQFVKTCKKLETEKEMKKWGKFSFDENVIESSTEEDHTQTPGSYFSKSSDNEVFSSKPSTSVSSASKSSEMENKFLSKSSILKMYHPVTVRPKTGISLSRRLLEKDLIFKDKTRKTLIKSLSKSLSYKTESSDQSDDFNVSLAGSVKSDSLKSPSDNCFNIFDKMEGLWWIYNQVKLDCTALKKQRRKLIQNNNELKENVRDVLEAVALNQTIPSLKFSSARIGSKRFILSAPVYSH